MVGRSMGNMKPHIARLAFKLSLIFIYVIKVVIIIAALIWRDDLAKLFSNDEEVAELVSSWVPILCIDIINDAAIGISSGTFYGLGRQKYMMYINSVGYLLVAFPLAYCLVFKANVGLAGLWYSNCVGGALCAGSCLLVLFFWVDWEEEKKYAIRRLSTTASSMTVEGSTNNTEPLLQDEQQVIGIISS
jgi:MATE family multidrug resistance protein